ncbi:MAG: PEP/pyruvate-binding domain-containing protein, partial [Planctomycetota bacterium]
MDRVCSTVFRIDGEAPLPKAAGGKALGLQRLAAAGLPVPASWVVLPHAPAEDLRDLVDELRQRALDRLVVRSSARDEDGAPASFAGVHLSLQDVPLEDLVPSLSRVARSPLSRKAQAYRCAMGLAPADGPGAVVIQPQLQTSAAGVAFDTGEGGERVVIEAVRGSGLALQSGHVGPECVWMEMDGAGWCVRRRRRGSQCPHENVVSATAAVEVACAVSKLRAARDRPHDVEWVLSDGAVWFVQARSQTRPPPEPLPDGDEWTRANLGETFPEIPSAFTRSLLPRVSGGGMARMLRAFGLRPFSDDAYCRCVLGRPVLSERMYAVADAWGIPRAAVRADVGSGDAAAPSPRGIRVRDVLRHPRLALGALRVSWRIERRVRCFLGELDREREAFEAHDLAALPMHRLVQLARGPYLQAAEDAAFHASCLFAVLVWAQRAAGARLARVGHAGETLAQLVADAEGTVTTRQLEDLLSLAATWRRTETAPSFTTAVTRDHGRRAHWRTACPPRLWAEVKAWLARYGHRGPWESDLASPRYAEDLRLLATALFPLLRDGPPETRVQRRQRRAAAGRRAWAEVRAQLGWSSRVRVRRLVRRLQRLTALREAIRDRTMAFTAALRRLVLEFGVRLTADGRLSRAEDVWHLAADDLERAVEDPAWDVAAAVADERRRRAAWRRVRVPVRFRGDVPLAGEGPGAPAEGDANVLRGTPVSPGLAEGPVRVLASVEEGASFGAGEILVAPATDPAWCPLFARAGAVVV